MADITNYTPITVSTLMANINTVKYNPSAIQRTALAYLSDVTNGLVDIVDPTNPFIFLLEMAAVETASGIIENSANMRMQYPSLAQSTADLYNHMSDKDFINRFATPSNTVFSFTIQRSSLISAMVDIPLEKCGKVTIPRNTVFTVNGLNFSLQYPIDIRHYYTGVTQISYDTAISSPLQVLNTNVIDFSIRTDQEAVDWIYFEVVVQQFLVNSTHYPIMASSYFSHDIVMTDQFYYCRVYMNGNNTNGNWVEILTTHTDQVYDPFKATAVLKVIDNVLNVSIPQIYINNLLVSGSIRVDIYETKGVLSANMANYLMTSFTTQFLSLDETRDINVYTTAMSKIAFMAYSDKLVNGGTNGTTFAQLRNQVIYNALGTVSVPITNVQLATAADTLGFSIVKNVDMITNRIFLATKLLPAPLDGSLITPCSLALNTFITDFTNLSGMTGVLVNGNRITLTPETVYSSYNGIINVYPAEQVALIKAATPTDQATIVSKGNFLFTPFYYILDNTADEFISRAYHLDDPKTNGLNFISHNHTTGYQVNTASYGISRSGNGYKLTIITKSDDTYKAIADINVKTQLCFTPYNEAGLAYINGTLLTKTPDGERVWEFLINTNWDIDNLHNLILTNFKMFNSTQLNLATPLTGLFDILYTSDSVSVSYVHDVSSAKLGGFLLPNNSVVVTNEQISVNFGLALNNLWSSCRSVTNSATYQLHPTDVPMVYETDVYSVDPITGSIFSIVLVNGVPTPQYTILHPVGSPVLGIDNLPVYKHRAGDIILDNYGVPLPANNKDVLRYMDILFMEGVYYFSNKQIYLNYIKEVTNIIAGWVTNELSTIASRLLEQTNIYYYAKRAIGPVNVLDRNGIITSIESRQTFTVDYYVTNNVYIDLIMRKTIENKTIDVLDKLVKLKTVSISNMVTTLRDTFNNDLVNIKITGLGGAKNLDAVTIVNDEDGLSLNKILVSLEDGSLIVQEDVVINFYDHQLVIN